MLDYHNGNYKCMFDFALKIAGEVKDAGGCLIKTTAEFTCVIVVNLIITSLPSIIFFIVANFHH